jgi:hypothetical protein
MKGDDTIALQFVDDEGNPTIPDASVSISNIDDDLPLLIRNSPLTERMIYTVDGVPLIIGYADRDAQRYDVDQRVMKLTIVSKESAIVQAMKSWTLESLQIPDTEICVFPTLHTDWATVTNRIFRNVRTVLELIVRRIGLYWATSMVTVPGSLHFGGKIAQLPLHNYDWAPANMTFYDFVSLIAKVLNCVVDLANDTFIMMPKAEFLGLRSSSPPTTLPYLRNTVVVGKPVRYEVVDVRYNGRLTTGSYIVYHGTANQRVKHVSVSASSGVSFRQHTLGTLPVIDQATDVRDLFVHINSVIYPITFSNLDHRAIWEIESRGTTEMMAELSLIGADSNAWRDLVALPYAYVMPGPVKYFVRSVELSADKEVARITAQGYEV